VQLHIKVMKFTMTNFNLANACYLRFITLSVCLAAKAPSRNGSC